MLIIVVKSGELALWKSVPLICEQCKLSLILMGSERPCLLSTWP